MVDNYLQALIDTAHEQGTKKVDEQEVRERYRSDAIWRIKWSLIHDRIVAQESLSVSDAELDTRIQQLIEQDKVQGGKNEAYYQSEEGGNRIKSEMLEDKVIALITDAAKVKNRKVKGDTEKESNLIVT
jgi:FKBP-type peptidyl-prolyl cis-trans isomerase (trigger factor)